MCDTPPEEIEKLLDEEELALLLGAERANVNDLSPQAQTALLVTTMFVGISPKPSGRSTCCPNHMEMIGDLVFECSECGHTEIGCTHDRTTNINGRKKCLVCKCYM